MARVLRAAWLAAGMAVLTSLAVAGEQRYLVTAPDGVQLAVQEQGNPAGTPIVFIHGLLGSRLNWSHQVDSPELQRHRLITYDLRGHGLSDKPAEAAAYRDGRAWGDDLAAVLKATGAKRPVLVGWSLGGVVISNYLAQHGDADLSGVVYVNGVVELTGPLITPHDATYAGLASEDLTIHLDAVRDFLRLCFHVQPDTATFERLLSSAAMASWTMTRAVPSMTVLAAAGLPKATVPVLMLYGEKDLLVNVDTSIARAKALNPRIQTQRYEHAGHAPFAEDPQRFNRDLAAFVDAATRPSAKPGKQRQDSTDPATTIQPSFNTSGIVNASSPVPR